MSPPPLRPFLLVGLTGGIATGKSTVTEVLSRLGCVIIDADRLARDVVARGEPALARIVEEFGPEVLQADGTLDRTRLGAIVFADADRRRRLEAITHPEIRARLERRLGELAAEGFAGIVVFDAPVMIESGNYRNMDRLVVVVTDEATQAARLIARDGLTREEAARRIASQMPVAEKAKLADYVIDNSGDRAATEAQAREVLGGLRAELSVSKLLTGFAARLAVVFPVNMGNRGQNELDVRTTFRELVHSSNGQFVGYHSRRSGNFLFREEPHGDLSGAIEVAQSVTTLRCIARRFPELVRINLSAPPGASVVRGSMILRTTGPRRLIAVFLSSGVAETCRWKGPMGTRFEILSWVSDKDLLCLYERPGEGGDVGQMTSAAIEELRKRSLGGSIFGTGRAMSVIQDIVCGQRLHNGRLPSCGPDDET